MFSRGFPILSEKIVSGIATILLALVPIFFVPLAWITIPQSKFLLITIGVCVGIGAFAIGRLVEGVLRVPRATVFWVAASLPLVYCISALLSPLPDTFVGAGVARDTVAVALLWYFSYLLGVYGFSSRERVLSAYQITLGVAVVATFFQLVRLVVGPDAFTFGGALVGPTASIVGSWHDLGIFLGLVALLSAAFIPSSHAHGTGRMVAMAALGISTVGLIVVSFSDIWIAIALAALLLAGYYLYTRRDIAAPFVDRIKALPVALMLCLALFSVAMGLGKQFIQPLLPTRLNVSQLEVRPSWKGTFEVATAAHRSSSTLFGSGPNTFTRQWGLYKPAGVNETQFWNVDFADGVGFIPTAFVTVGAVGLLAWFVFLSLFVWSGVRALMRALRDASVEPIAAGLFVGTLFLWGLHVTYPPGIAITVLAFLLSGVTLAWFVHSGLVPTRTIYAESPQVVRFGTYAILGVLAAAALVVGLMVLRALASDVLVNKAAVTFNKTDDVGAAQKTLSQALFLVPSNDRAHRASVELGILELGRLARSDAKDDALFAQLQDGVARAIQHGLSAVSADSGDYENWVSLARLYEQLVGAQVQGAYERAQEAYTAAATANPTNPAPHLFLARLALVNKDEKTAREEIARALEIKVNYAPAHFLLSQIEASNENAEAALVSAERAVQSAPEEPLAWFQVGVLLYAKQDYEKSAVAFEQAVLRNNTYANALYFLALSYAQLGRTDDAVAALRQVLLSNPDNAEVKALIERLSSGESVTSKDTPEETPAETL